MVNKKVILILLFTSIVCFIIGFFFFEPDSEDLRKQMFAYKVHANKKYELVVAGDSRTYRGVSTNIIGNRLDKTAINLGFSSGGFSEKMFDLIENKLINKKGNIIILGVSPLTLTIQAAENGHIERLLALKQEEVIEILYLNMLLNIFAPTTPRYLWNSVFNKPSNIDNYLQEVNIKEGWVKSDYLFPNSNEALSSYKHTFTHTQISDQIILELYHQVQKWTNEGHSVFGFIPPSSANIEELERQYSDWKDYEFIEGFIKAGGKWIAFDEIYSSYDGSHLDSKSAIKLSNEIANAIKTKTFLSQLEEGVNIKTKYYQFESKYVFQNDFEQSTNNILETDMAYSGKKVVLIDSNQIYLGLYQTDLNNIIKNKISKILIDLYVYYENENTSARLIFDLNQNDKITVWKGLELSNIVKPGHWGHVKFEFDIPENVNSPDFLKIYIQNLNKTKVLIDDFKLDMY